MAIVAASYLYVGLNAALSSVVMMNALLFDWTWKIAFMLNLIGLLMMNRYLFGLPKLVLVGAFFGLAGLILFLSDRNDKLIATES